MKRSVTIFALVGLVGCFLPFIGGISFFQFRHLEWLPIILMTGAFVVPMIAGLMGTNTGAAVAGLIGFGYIGFKFGTGLWDLAIHAEIGGKMMAVGAVGGFVASLGALVDRKRA